MADCSDTIERVAAAIYGDCWASDMSEEHAYVQEHYRDMARAAIEALKAPLPEKVWKEAYGLSDLICPNTTDPESEINGIFATILDAALTTPPPT